MPGTERENSESTPSPAKNEYVMLVAGDDVIQVGTQFGDPVVVGRATDREKEIARCEFNNGVERAIEECRKQAKLCHAEDGDVALDFVADRVLPKLKNGRS